MMNFNDQYLKKGKINVFKGNDGYKNGEQERDFVYTVIVSTLIFFQ